MLYICYVCNVVHVVVQKRQKYCKEIGQNFWKILKIKLELKPKYMQTDSNKNQ